MAACKAAIAADAPLALDILADILTESTFDRDELEREKGVILQEIGAVEDTPDDLIYDAFMETAFAGQPVGRPILGTPDTIKSFDADTIKRIVPVQRAGTPDEVAALAGFLVSAEAGYITGQTLFVDGGLTLFADFRSTWSSE